MRVNIALIRLLKKSLVIPVVMVCQSNWEKQLRVCTCRQLLVCSDPEVMLSHLTCPVSLPTYPKVFQTRKSFLSIYLLFTAIV